MTVATGLLSCWALAT